MRTSRTVDALEPRIPDRRPGWLAPMRSRDFRLLWFGLIVSNLGTWVQFTALGYEVVRLAPTPHAASLDVGLIGASRAIPAILLSPLAGVVADRFPRRRVLFTTNGLQAAFSALLAVIVMSGRADIPLLMLLSALLAGTQAFDVPARQSWVPLLVPREYVANAIGLNSVAFNAPAVVGPPVAGIIIAASGVGPCMMLNAVATLAVVAALVFMAPVAASSTVREGVWRSIRNGIAFIRHDPVLGPIVVLLLVTSICVRPYNFLLPAYAAHVLHTDARGLGTLMAAVGAGSIVAAFVTAGFVPRRRSVMWAGAALTIALGAIGLAAARTMPAALAVLVLMGFGTLTFLNASNILLQTLSPADMRGRVISVYSMIVLGLVPLGTLVLGGLASLTDLPSALTVGGIITLVATAAIYAAGRRLRMV